MNRMARTLIALLVVLLLTAAGSAMAREVASGKLGENLKWSVRDDYTLTISGAGDIPNGPLAIYSSLIKKVVVGEGVTSIGERAFDSYSALEAVVLPPTLQSIGSDAFMYCSNLLAVEIPNGVASIGAHAFASCSSLSAVSIPSSVKSIGKEAFAYCFALSSVTGAEGVETIGQDAFVQCGVLKSYPWSNCLKSIGNTAFSQCDLSSVDLPDTVETIGNAAFSHNANLTRATLPENKNFTAIPDTLFCSCGMLEAVEVPDSVTRIGADAFNGCSSAVITLPENISTIGNYAFANVKKIICNPASTTATVMPVGQYFSAPDAPDLLLYFDGSDIILDKYIGAGGAVTIPAGVKEISNSAFVGCDKITSVTIPDGVTKIRVNAFNGCTSLKSVTIPESVTLILQNAFYNCSSLESVSIPSGVTRIEDHTFYGCASLKSVSIPSGVTVIGISAFEGCASLTDVTLPSGITEISNTTFKGCTSLTGIDIPSGVTSIGERAFEGCSRLTDVTIPDSVTKIWSYTFKDCTSATITLPDNAISSIGTFENVKAVVCEVHTIAARNLESNYPFILKSNPHFKLIQRNESSAKVVSYSGPTDYVVIPDYVTEWIDRTTEIVNLCLPDTLDNNCNFQLKARNVTIPECKDATYWNLLTFDSIEKIWLPDNVEPSCLYGSLTFSTAPVVYGSAGKPAQDWADNFELKFCAVDSENPYAISLNGSTTLGLDVGEVYTLNVEDFTVFPFPAGCGGAYSFALEGDAATLEGNAITALKEGEATLKVTLDGKYTSDIPLTVHPALQSFALISTQIAKRGAEFIVEALIPASENSVGRLTWVQDGEVVYIGTEHTRRLTAPATGDQTVVRITAPSGVYHEVTLKLYDSISDPYLDSKLYDEASGEYVAVLNDPLHIYVDVDGETLVDDRGSYAYMVYSNYFWFENGVLYAGNSVVDSHNFTVCDFEGEKHMFYVSIRCTHLNTEQRDEQQPTCEFGALKAITFCNDCESIIINVDGETVAIKYEDIYDPGIFAKYNTYYYIMPLRHKDKTLMEAKAPTCTEPGNIECYDCNYCDAHFKLENGEYYKLEMSTWQIPATGHQNLSLIQASAPTCTEAGNSAYYTCDDCGAFFVKDGESYTEVKRDSWVIPATNHPNRTLIPATGSTCTKRGNSAYYTCNDCGSYINEKGEEIKANSWLLPLANVHHAVNGVCKDCNKNFNLTWVQKMTLPASLSTIEEEAFVGSSAQAIVVPDGCSAIGKRAFADCKSLRYVFLPKALEGKLPDDAFEGCSAAMHLIYK